ncbi:MAG: ATP-dependent endonuclease [Candidatus Hodarchaeota archaeon]
MRFLEILLKNFRSITNLQLSNLRRLNCFIGPHNSGKSNILDGISVFWDAFIRAKVQQKQLQTNLGQQLKQDFDRNILSYLGDTKTVHGSFELSLEGNMSNWVNNSHLQEYFTLTANYHKHQRAHDFLNDFIDEISAKITPESISSLKFELDLNPEFLSFVNEKLYFHLRNGEEILFQSEKLPISIIQQAIGSAYVRRFHDIATEYDILQENLEDLIKNKYTALAEIERFLKDIIGQEFVFELGQTQGKNQEIEVTIERAFTSPLWRISTSTIRIIALAYMLTSSPLNQIIIIDEPEMHLHPIGERKFARKLETLSSNHQFFFATHSTRFLIGHAYLVDLKSGWTQIKSIRGEKSMKNVVKLLGIRPSDSFGSDVVIFVEGRTDARVFRVFEDKIMKDHTGVSPRNRVSYISVAGWSNMAFVISLELLRSKFVRSRALAITDGDIVESENYDKIKNNWETIFPENTFFSLKEESIESLFLNNEKCFYRLAEAKSIKLPNIEELKKFITRKRNRGLSDKLIIREITEKYFRRKYSSSFAELLAKTFTKDEIPLYLLKFFQNHILN